MPLVVCEAYVSTEYCPNYSRQSKRHVFYCASNALDLGSGDNVLSFDWIGLWKTTKSGQFRSMIWEIGE